MRANDRPHGVFTFDLNSRSLSVAEPSTGSVIAELTVVREFGTIGTVNVQFQTQPRQGTIERNLATQGADYFAEANSIVFEDGETAKTVNITINSDDDSELDELFEVVIVQTVLISESQGPYTVPSPSIGASFTAVVEIPANNDPAGVIGFSSPGAVLVVPEDDSLVCTNISCTPAPIVELTRNGGAFGEVTVSWSTSFSSSNGALPGFDFTPSFGTVTFADLQRSANLTVGILDDDIPELSESFIVNLLSVEGGARFQASTNLEVQIDDSDDPFGRIGFVQERQTITISEPGDESLVTFNLTREGGTIGMQVVSWALEGATMDFTPRSGTVVFDEGERLVELVIIHLPDNIPELDEQVVINLLDIQGGAVIDTGNDVATVSVPANDEPHGVFEVSQSSLRTEASEGSTITVTIVRNEGLFGQVDVPVSLRSPTDEELFELDLIVSSSSLLRDLFASLAFNPPTVGLPLATQLRTLAPVGKNSSSDTSC